MYTLFDDKITIAPDLPCNASHIAAVIPLAIHTICRPLSKQEHIHRVDIISTSKLTVEGAIEEMKTIFGWKDDTHRLIMSLPDQK